MDSKIKSVKAREVLDSRGNPTVEVDIITSKGLSRAIVPSGASTGTHEALELRDKQKRYLGKGVQKAVSNINNIISKKVIGLDATKQKEIDKVMISLDGTENKSNLGANAILGVSMAVCRAGALSKNVPLYQYIASIAKNKSLYLPHPYMNIINGGKHAQNDLDVQEFMIIPQAKTFSTSLQHGSEIYHNLKKIITEKYGGNAANVGDEGGFAPPISTMEEALQLLEEACSSYSVKYAVDCAASEFFNIGDWSYHFEKRIISNEMLMEHYIELTKKYPLVSIEDPFHEDDFDTSAKITSALKKIDIVGDDLLVTNPVRIKKAIEMKSCNTLLLKVNQIGSVTEAINAANLSFKNKWNVIVSHRSGETEDSFISDLAVGLGCKKIKAGAPCRSDRVAKYNQLLRIEEHLGKKAKF